MSLISRVTVLFRGIFDKRVRNLEWERPETVYEHAIEKKREGYQRLRDSVAGLKAEQERLSGRMKKNLRSLEDTERALQLAINREDHTQGPQLLEQRNRLRQIVEGEAAQHRVLSERAMDGTTKLQDVRQAIEKLESEKKESVAEIRMLQASHDIESLWNGFHVAPEDVALKGLRDRVEVEREADKLDRGMNTDRIVQSTVAAQDFAELCKQKNRTEAVPVIEVMDRETVDAELLPEWSHARR